MKLDKLPLRILALPAIVLLAVLLLGGALVFYTASWSGESTRQLAQERVAVNGVRQKLAQVDQERALIERYREAYANLQRGGAIGSEQRVNWLDALREANQRVQTLGVDYQLSQQSASPLKIDAAGYQLRQTSMKLDIKLLHEEDLQEFLRALSAQHAGMYILQACNVSRSGSGEFSVRFESRLNAQCELAWLSLAAVGADAGERTP